jgi:hypothetical protein
MDGNPTVEMRADGLVGVGRDGPGGGFFITLRSPGGRSVYIGPYDNRDVAKLEATRVRGFVAAVIRQALNPGRDDRNAGEVVTCGDSIGVISAHELGHQIP